MVYARLVYLMFCLLLSQNAIADSESGRHWSDGVYFPPQSRTEGAPESPYIAPEQPQYAPAGKKRYNPWTVREKDGSAQQPQSYESLGYPSEVYDPYNRSQQTSPGQYGGYAPRHIEPRGVYDDADQYRAAPRSGPQYAPEGYRYGYESQPYDAGAYYPRLYDFSTDPGGGLNPFFLYGAGVPYLPDWW